MDISSNDLAVSLLLALLAGQVGIMDADMIDESLSIASLVADASARFVVNLGDVAYGRG
jgi:hypothetical protein